MIEIGPAFGDGPAPGCERCRLGIAVGIMDGPTLILSEYRVAWSIYLFYISGSYCGLHPYLRDEYVRVGASTIGSHEIGSSDPFTGFRVGTVPRKRS